MSQDGPSERTQVTLLLSHAFGSSGGGKVAISLKTKELQHDDSRLVHNLSS